MAYLWALLQAEHPPCGNAPVCFTMRIPGKVTPKKKWNFYSVTLHSRSNDQTPSQWAAGYAPASNSDRQGAALFARQAPHYLAAVYRVLG